MRKAIADLTHELALVSHARGTEQSELARCKYSSRHLQSRKRMEVHVLMGEYDIIVVRSLNPVVQRGGRRGEPFAGVVNGNQFGFGCFRQLQKNRACQALLQDS